MWANPFTTCLENFGIRKSQNQEEGSNNIFLGAQMEQEVSQRVTSTAAKITVGMAEVELH